MAKPLDLAYFQPLLGQEFAVLTHEAGDAVASLRLDEANRLPDRGGMPRESFSLIFHGGLDIRLDQDSFWLRHPNGETTFTFLVPISEDADARRYQAIFN